MKRRGIVYQVLVVIFGIVVFYTAAELATRTVSVFQGKGFFLAPHEVDPQDPTVTRLYRFHPFTGMTFTPGVVFQAGHPRQSNTVTITVDRYGFIAEDLDLTVAKDADEIRVATIGASTTASLNLEFRDNWPGRLQTLLRQAFPDKKVRVINAGVPGYDTAQSVGNLALRVMPFRPDVVIVYHAYNDLKTIKPRPGFEPDYSHIHSTPYGYHQKPGLLVRLMSNSMLYVRTRNKYRAMKAEVKATEDLRRALTGEGRTSDIPLEAASAFEQHIRSMVGIARAGGARVVLASFATVHDPRLVYSRKEVFTLATPLQKNELYGLIHFTPGLTVEGVLKGIGRYNEILRQVARDMGTGWMDLERLVPHEDQFFVDRVHFSSEGAARVAESLFPVVAGQLRQ